MKWLIGHSNKKKGFCHVGVSLNYDMIKGWHLCCRFARLKSVATLKMGTNVSIEINWPK